MNPTDKELKEKRKLYWKESREYAVIEALLQGRAEFRKEMDKFRKWLIENLTEEDHYVAKNPPQIVKLLRADVVLKKFDELLKGGKG